MNHRILGLTDSAIVAYLLDQGPPTENVYPAKRAASKALPNVVVESQEWSPIEGQEFTGNCTVETQVRVTTSAPEDLEDDTGATQEASDALVDAVSDAFAPGNENDPTRLAQDITRSAQADAVEWTCYLAIVSGGSRTREGDSWVDAIRLTLHCASSIVP